MGLLDKFNRGLNAVETGLLGNATAYNPALSQYLSPGVLQKANSDARMQLGLAMLAASESGMGLGQGLMMAQQMAGQAFQQPLESDLRATMTADAMRRVQEQRDAKAKLDQQIALFRQQNPEYANEPDEIILKRMDPSFGMDVSRLALDQQRAAQDIYNSDRTFGLQERQLQQSQQNADRSYQLQQEQLKLDQLGAQRAEQDFRLKLRALESEGRKVDPTEARQRRDAARSSNNMLTLLTNLKTDLDTYGTEYMPTDAKGRMSATYGQIISEYKQAKQLGTLDKGLLDLFEKIITDPTSFSGNFGTTNNRIRAQIDSLIDETKRQYESDYEYLSTYGLDQGFKPFSASGNLGMPSTDAINAELRRRGLLK